MRYLPDTNVIVALAAGQTTVVQRLRFLSTSDVGLSAIVKFELLYGAINSTRRDENLQSVQGLRFPFLPFDVEDALRAAEIRAGLKSLGTPIGPYDTLLAGQALARDLTLVTRNTREFSRVEGLRLENWEA